MKHFRLSDQIIVLTCLLGCLAIGVRLIADGLPGLTAQVRMENVGTYWQRGDHLGEIKNIIQLGPEILVGGVRWQIAQMYLRQSYQLQQQGDLQESYVVCVKAYSILKQGRYDHSRRGENSVESKCQSIEYERLCLIGNCPSE